MICVKCDAETNGGIRCVNTIGETVMKIPFCERCASAHDVEYYGGRNGRMMIIIDPIATDVKPFKDTQW